MILAIVYYSPISMFSIHISEQSSGEQQIKCKINSVISLSFCSPLSVQCVTITSCGNYAVVGMTSGHIELFNMQSGLHRGELGRPRGGCGLLRYSDDVMCLLL